MSIEGARIPLTLDSTARAALRSAPGFVQSCEVTTPQRIGLAVAALYVAGAGYVVIDERRHPGFLSNMGTYLVTAPISLPLEIIGMKPDVGNPVVAGLLVLGNVAQLFYFVSWLARIFIPVVTLRD